MKCSHCGWSGMANYCPECGNRLVPDRDVEDEMIRKVEAGLATEAEDERTLNYEMGSWKHQGPSLADVFREELPEEDLEELPESVPAFERTTRLPEYSESEEDDEEEEEDEDDDEEDDEDYEEDYDHERRPSRLGSALNTGFRKLWDLICTVLRLASAVLMLACAFMLAWGFLGSKPKGGFPDLHHVTEDPLAVYLLGALAILVFAAIQTLWILKRSRIKTQRGVEYRDKGHGITAFLLFALMHVATEPMILFLPDGRRAIFTGIRYLMKAVDGLGDPFLALAVMGLILCILRRICGADRI